MKLFETYGFPNPKLKSINDLHVTAGWVAAVSRVQNALIEGRLRLPPHKPALVMSTAADEVLDQEKISNRTRFLCSTMNSPEASGGDISVEMAADDKNLSSRPIWVDGVVERRIGTSIQHPSSHDVLAGSMVRVDEALKHMERWLRTHFPHDGDLAPPSPF